MTGAELRAIRESFGLTQQRFAEEVGLEGEHCGATIRKMENGQRRVNRLVARNAELMVEVRRLRGRRRKTVE